jgi:hypothetical protein
MTPTKTIERCIRRCARHKDGRGPWQAARACAVALGGSRIDRDTAEAARRLGEWIRSQK